MEYLKKNTNDIKTLIFEKANIIKRKIELYTQIKEINSELGQLFENDRTLAGSFGFKNSPVKNPTGFVNKMDISHVNHLANEFDMKEHEVVSEEKLLNDFEKLKKENEELKKELKDLKK